MEQPDPCLRIVTVPPGSTPVFLVDAVVVEDDTYLVLGAEPVARETHEPPGELLGEARASIQPAPGTVVVRSGPPLELHAIVHDLDAEPSWRVEWVSGALAEVLREAEGRGLRSLALPVLGAVHGDLTPRRFAELLGAALHDARARCPEEIWLTVPAGAAVELESTFTELGLEVRR